MGHIYTVAVGTDFLTAVVKNLFSCTEPLADTTLYVPTRRLVKALHTKILDHTRGAPTLMPNIKPLADGYDIYEKDAFEDISALSTGTPSDFSADIFLHNTATSDLFPAVDVLYRRFWMVDAIKKFYTLKGQRISFATALGMADSLVWLFDKIALFEVEFDKFTSLFAQGDFSEHWAHSLIFLNHIYPAWQDHLMQIKALDIGIFQRQCLENLHSHLELCTTEAQRIFLVGVTGMYPVVKRIMTTVSTLKNGVLFLPGYDTTFTSQQKSHILHDETHPLYSVEQWLHTLKVAPKNIENTKPARANIFKATFLSAKDSDCWRSVPPAKEGFEGITFLRAQDRENEALAIALMMRNALEIDGKTVALTTPDRYLSRMVISILKRWNIVVDDSSGQPLGSTVVAVFMRLVFAVIAENFSPQSLVNLFKHPFCSVQMDRRKFQRASRLLEMLCLRGYLGSPSIENFIQHIMRLNSTIGKSRPIPLDTIEEMRTLLEALNRSFAPLLQVRKTKTTLKTLLTAHISVCENLSGSDTQTGEEVLYGGYEGKNLAIALREILECAKHLSFITVQEYADSFVQLLAGKTVRKNINLHPRLNIWGTLEARLQSVDLMIVGGMNEGVFPSTIHSNPWLSKSIAGSVGLPTVDFFVGLAAQDVLSFCGCREVTFTRSETQDGVDTLPSRWWQRFKAVAKATGLKALPETPIAYKNFATQLYESSNYVKDTVKVHIPKPRPPSSIYHPTALSVTNIETWLNDPYQIYAKYILGLYPIKKVWEQVDASAKGILMHKIFEEFVTEYPNYAKNIAGKTESEQKTALPYILAIRDRVFAPLHTVPEVKMFWIAQSTKILEGFLTHYFHLRHCIRYSVCEQASKGIFTTKGGIQFTIKAIADRIDVLRDGKYRIVDYKTGTMPSGKKIQSGEIPQLALQAYMAKNGGFGNSNKQDVVSLEIWQAKPAFTVKAIEGVELVNRSIESTLERIGQHIDSYHKDNSPYCSEREAPFPDYKHLVRIKEWGIAESTAEGMEDV